MATKDLGEYASWDCRLSAGVIIILWFILWFMFTTLGDPDAI